MLFCLVEKRPMADQCPNTNEVIGLSVTTALFAIAFVSSTLWNYCKRPAKSQNCPYCSVAFLPQELRAHLLNCSEHLKHWTARGSSRNLSIFTVDHPSRQASKITPS